MRTLAGLGLACALTVGLASIPAFADETPTDVPDPDVPAITVNVSPDEKVVTVTAAGADLAGATAVTFNTWSLAGGQDDLVAHGARQQADGSWLSTIYIAAESPLEPGVPYNGLKPCGIHRLYNPYSNEHLYTPTLSEADSLARNGWNYEGVAWVTPEDTEDASPKVYRLGNPYTGLHHYTMDLQEYNRMAADGWQREGIAFTSDPDEAVPVYRLYNPGDGSHHYTTDVDEYGTLSKAGWQAEGVAFYGAAINSDGSWSASDFGRAHSSAGEYAIEATAVFSDDGADVAVAAGEAADDEATDAPVGDDPTTDDPSTDDPAPAPAPTPIGTASFSISSPTADAHIENVNNAAGTFDVVIDQISSVSGTGRVQTPTWSRDGGQSDLHWLWAWSQGDGTYRSTANVRDYGLSHDYITDVYVTGGNGVMANVKRLTAQLTLANFAHTFGGPYGRFVQILNPGPVGKVEMVAWTDANGGDDVRVYQATDGGNGCWTAWVGTENFYDTGTAYVDIYCDGEVRNFVAFQVEPWELPAPEQVAMNRRVRDLASPTRYLIAIDTTNCFIGIYTGSRGNWTNYAFWECSVGAPWTPTVRGIFSVGNRGYSFGEHYTCYYWTQFYGDYLFHSIKYEPGTFIVQDGSMGVHVSEGCVRLWIDRAKWIHDVIPRGTTVLSF